MRVGFSTAGFRRGSVIFSTLPSMDAAPIMTNWQLPTPCPTHMTHLAESARKGEKGRCNSVKQSHICRRLWGQDWVSVLRGVGGCFLKRIRLEHSLYNSPSVSRCKEWRRTLDPHHEWCQMLRKPVINYTSKESNNEEGSWATWSIKHAYRLFRDELALVSLDIGKGSVQPWNTIGLMSSS
jgi:hypothetical protein